MTETGGVIEGDGIRIESTSETAEQMLQAVTPPKDEPTKFKAVKAEGEKEEKPKSAISEAASKLGKKGAQAAAKARAAKTEEAETPEPEKEQKEPVKAESDEPDEEEQDEDTDPEVRKSRAAERVKEATRKEAEAKREAARLKAENEELRRARPAAEAKPPITREEHRPAPTEDPRPKADDFAEWAEYEDARDAWNRRKWTREAEAERAAKAEQEQVHTTVKTYQEAIAEAVAENPEFWDKVPAIHAESPLGQEIVRAGPNAPGILLHLAENPKVYSRLSKISDLREVIREVGKIEARLEDATAGNPSEDERPGPNPEISRARPPARPVAASPHIASGDTSGEPKDDAPLSAFVKADFGRRAASRR